MNQKMIAPLVIVVIVAVAVGAYIVTKGGGGTSSGGLGGIPMFAGAIENANGAAQADAYLEGIGLSEVKTGMYTIAQDAATIASWYVSKMTELGWTKENEATVGSNIFLMFKRGDDGAVISIYSNYHGETDFLIMPGHLEDIQHLWSITFQYSGVPTTVAGAGDGQIFESDNTWLENYVNENVFITFYTTEGYLRDVGNPDDGLVVTVGNSQRGWGPYQATVKGETYYGNGYVESNGAWTGISGLSGNQGIRWKLYVPVTLTGSLGENVSAYLYLWSDQDVTTSRIQTSGKISPATKLLWDYDDNLTITVSCSGDSFEQATVRLYGFNWIA